VGCEQGTGAHYNGLQGQIENRYFHVALQNNQRALACHKMEIDARKKRVGPSGPSPWLSDWADKWHIWWHGCVIIT